MASTTALITGLSGLSSNSRRLDVIGNNIANVNTVAFKSNRMLFTSSFSRSFSLGTAPSESTGGTNPGQVGLGVQVGGTQRNFSVGSITPTGVATDVAIEGDGFFIVEQAGERLFTRSGAFTQNEVNDLVSLTGAKVMGYNVDAQFNIVEGVLEELNIPVGSLTLAEATRDVVLNGNLNASGEISTGGSITTSRELYVDDDGDPLTPPGVLTPATTATDLTDGASHLWIDDGAGGYFLGLESGSDAVVTISGVEKGGQDLGTATFAFTDAATALTLGVDAFGPTVDDFLTFLDQYLGLDNTSINGHDLGGGVTLDPTGQIVITGNEGTVQDLNIDTADLVVTYPGATVGAPINQPFVMTKANAADGESVRTSYVVYDSLGTPLTVDLTLVLQDAIDGQGTVWEFLVESSDNDSVERVAGIGLVEFDANGEFVSSTNQSFSITRENGAVSPLTINMAFDTGSNAVSSLSDSASAIAAVFQDGSPIGTLNNFSIGSDGVITGSFTNGLTRTISQVAVAKFSNPQGLVDVGDNTFGVGPNSGTPIITSPTAFGTGRLVGGALELSNVDLSQEFINMILSSTGYSASSRIITTTNELIDQLLLIGR